jgi:hypothetical protein
MLLVPMLAGLVLLPQGRELFLALGIRTIRGIERGGHFANLLGLEANLLLGRGNRVQATFKASGKTL